MSRYLMVMWSGGGANPPQLAIAKRLLRAGHEVSVLGPRSIGEAVAASGARFDPYRHAPEHDLADPEQDLLRDWEARGPAAAGRMRDHVMYGTAASICEDVEERLAGPDAPDVLLTDYVLLGSYLAAERTQTPLVAVLHTIYTLPRPGVPPFGPGLAPARHLPGRVRDRLLKRLQQRFYDGRLDELNELRERLGLRPLASTLDLITGADRLLILSSPAFDYPGAIPDNARWVGAITDPDAPPPEPTRDTSNDEPSVLVSLSTTYQRQLPVLERIIEALGELPVRAVVTTGPAVRPEQLPRPANVDVLPSTPHHELLPSTDLVVTHGGHGTVMAALRHGVPVVCLPMGRDQRDIAARVVWRGVGVRGSAHASTERLRRLIARALDDGRLRTAARDLAGRLAEDDHDLAVRELEHVGPENGGRRRTPMTRATSGPRDPDTT